MIHLEFALKFFLEVEVDGKRQFIGPKGRDSLEGKSIKLKEHQLPLSHQKKELLPTHLQEVELEPYILMRGQLFYPWDQREEGNYWLRISQVSELSRKAWTFRILKKRIDWIYPFEEESGDRQLNGMELTSKIEAISDQLPIMLAYKKANGAMACLMIVEDAWPFQ